MTATLIIFGITALLLILSVGLKPNVKIGNLSVGLYWIIALIGAVILLISNLAPINIVIEKITANVAINPLKILTLFISMTAISIYLDEIGFFRFLAVKTLAYSGDNQKKLFILLYVTVSILTIVTSNDIIILTFTPFICYFAKNADIDATPYLFTEFVAANTWSATLIIGNPTNIYLASFGGIDFIEYLKVMILPAISIGVVSFILLYLIFRRKLKAKMQIVESEEVKIDKGSLIIGLIHLIGCTALLVISSYIKIEMWLITLIFAVSLNVSVAIYNLIKKQKQTVLLKVFKRAPFQLIPFILSMFVFVIALEYCGATKLFATFLDKFPTVISYGLSSFLFCNIINNIPMSVLFSSIITGANMTGVNGALYATIIGSNLGAILTPVGALAGIMWQNILKEHGEKFSFSKFLLYGSVISIPTIIVSLIVLSIIV